MMQAKKGELIYDYKTGMLTVAITGDIDHHTSKIIREELDSKMTELSPDKLVLDLAGVTFMDSSGLGLVLGRFSKAEAAGIDFSVINADRRVLQIFEMSGMTRMIKIEGEKTNEKQ